MKQLSYAIVNVSIASNQYNILRFGLIQQHSLVSLKNQFQQIEVKCTQTKVFSDKHLIQTLRQTAYIIIKNDDILRYLFHFPTQMVNLQVNQTEIKKFEDSFKQAVEQRTKQSYSTMLETYVAYKNLNEFSRQHFWEFIANQTGLQRERVYKFFRFTWTRQFYACLDDHRDSIKALVCQILDQLNEQKQTAIYSKVWNKVWPVYQDYDLHYDGTDQFVRNCVNWYFNKKAQNQPVIVNVTKPVLPAKPVVSIKKLQEQMTVTKQVVQKETKEQSDEVEYSDKYNYFGKISEGQYKRCFETSIEADSCADEAEFCNRRRYREYNVKHAIIGFMYDDMRQEEDLETAASESDYTYWGEQ
ncbi:Conserved_hypothetical protein [Hexamita inflata]|uniref:Uncharacterized protein n=1 Tax=Hexamita inflata TaxID=28002 RepID=A0ABP1LP93_9EUKA